jgi:DNA-binding CsgD family transcriptional regulator
MALTKLSHRHEALAFIIAAGTSTKEAARLTNFSPGHVSTLTHSAMFKMRVVQIQEEVGIKRLQSIQDTINDEARKSVDTVVEIRDDEEQLGSTRLSAANSLLDRADVPKTQVSHTASIEGIPVNLDAETFTLIAEGMAREKDIPLEDLTDNYFKEPEHAIQTPTSHIRPAMSPEEFLAEQSEDESQ